MVNLNLIGPVAPFLVSAQDLREVLATAEQILASTTESDLVTLLDSWETGLTWRSLDAEPVDSVWYVRALLVTCLRGLRGELAPKYHVLPGHE